MKGGMHSTAGIPSHGASSCTGAWGAEPTWDLHRKSRLLTGFMQAGEEQMASVFQQVELVRGMEDRRVGRELGFSQDSSSVFILQGGHWSRCPWTNLHG